MARSPEAVTELLRAAVKAVKDADVPKELQPAAFDRAVDLLADRAGGTASEPSGNGGGEKEDQTPPPDTSSRSGKVATVFGITAEEAEEIFDFGDDTLHLTVSRNRLSASRAEAVRQVGLAIVAARQAAGIDPDRTHTKHIREATNDLDISNKNTFQAEMAEMASDGWVSSKTAGQGRELKLISQGREAIRTLAPTLLGRS